MWTPEIVKARFIEAAATEQFLRVDGPAVCRSFWPSFLHDAEDREGWDDQARADNAERWKGRAPDGAIGRHAECLQWTAERIENEKTRKIVWALAFCRAHKRDFGALCRRKGWAKSTAYDRTNRIWDRLSYTFNNERLLLREPAAEWAGRETPIPALINATSGVAGEEPSTVKYTPGYRTEPSRDLLTTPEAVADFIKMLARRNARMRKLQAWRSEGVA
jgi:hypothetical protein